MKNKFLMVLILLVSSLGLAQDNVVIITPDQDTRVITTGIPFALIATDARAAGLGDMGVATSPDAYSQFWNASKNVFSENQSGVSLSYTPYLSKLVNDIGLASLTYYNRFNENSAFGVGFRYFSLGEIESTDNSGNSTGVIKPNEFTIDASYSIRLSDQFGMGVGLRYLRSDLKIDTGNNDNTVASTFSADITGYYQSEEQAYSDFNGRWRGGFAIQNIGPKFKYDEAGIENFQPTNLRLGGGFDFIFDEYNKLGVTAEFTKLLVPTPPVRGSRFEYTDVNDNGEYDAGTDVVIDDNPNYIIDGQDNDVPFLSGIFQSFGDAPGGFKEELQEFTYALGAEYVYQDAFSLRAGYFNEHETKGARKFFALGAGFKYNVLNLDMSYLFSSSKVPSPLEGTLRFSLTFNLGAGEYDEY
ncbi:type IX secretion system outer membrane channel protein PorV [Mesoflavibacter sp. CH_XMU1404-2]|uniref:type IX secretion system outer membrane channel protein PorV n=1 Tax=Mesoflavibacter sp. CH_XMU1404-2 TaxID=3107766 RepID=UPI00300A8BEC